MVNSPFCGWTGYTRLAVTMTRTNFLSSGSVLAMEVMDNWIEWLFKGSIPADCVLAAAIELLQSSDIAHG